MANSADSPAPPDPEPAPPGSRWETALLLVKLAADLISVPFHLFVFLFTRQGHRRRFRSLLADGTSSTAEKRS